MSSSQPVLFVSHGSPLSALGGDGLSTVWTALAARLSRPAAILAVSAHWESGVPLLGGDAQPETIHDFGGFPAALRRLEYPAPGAPDLARHLCERLSGTGLVAGVDGARGLDHGIWVPLLHLFPAADVPVVPLAVQPALGARHHFALGKALLGLAEENILILASGHLTHNLNDFFFRRGAGPSPGSVAFRDWAHAELMGGAAERLLDWESAPGATQAHPTPEHLMPLFVALGAAGRGYATEALGGGWVGGALAADNYLFTPA